jgi:hypothetical protein
MVDITVKKLIGDLDRIHQQTKTRLPNVDDAILKTISVVEEGNKPAIPTIPKVHLKLLSAYLDKMIKDIDVLISDYSKTLVYMKKYRVRLNELIREKDTVQRNISFEEADFQKFYAPIDNLWNKTVDLWNELVDSEEDLRKEARLKFIKLIYLPVLTVASIVFGLYGKFVNPTK